MKRAIEFDEGYWKNIKFNLIFIVMVCVTYVIVTKLLRKTPEFDNTDMLSRINDFEEIQVIKKDYTEKSTKIFKTIDTIKYDINQVQRIDEIKRYIADYKQLHKENEYLSSYNFCLLGGNLLNVFLELNLEKSTLEKNNKLIETNLNECKANFKE
jgi:Type VI secretion system, TssO